MDLCRLVSSVEFLPGKQPDTGRRCWAVRRKGAGQASKPRNDRRIGSIQLAIFPYNQAMSNSCHPTKPISHAATRSPCSARSSFRPRPSSSATSPRPTTCPHWCWPSGGTSFVSPDPAGRPWDCCDRPCCGSTGILRYLVLYGLVLAIFNSLWTLSVALNGAAVSTVLAYCSAGFTALLGWWLLKERLDWGKLLAVALSLGGCVLVSGALDPAAWRVNLLGIITGILSGPVVRHLQPDGTFGLPARTEPLDHAALHLRLRGGFPAGFQPAGRAFCPAQPPARRISSGWGRPGSAGECYSCWRRDRPWPVTGCTTSA